jgi:hypothetical protein
VVALADPAAYCSISVHNPAQTFALSGSKTMENNGANSKLPKFYPMEHRLAL